jgi:hypothetical protein
MSKISTSSRDSRDTNRIAGFQKHFSASATLTIGNASYTQAAVIQVYQDELNADAAVAAALAAYRLAVATAKAAHAKTAAFDLQVRKFIVGSFGEPPGPAGDFGIEATVHHPPDAETKAQAVVKREATRTARHTMGSQQKAKITGETPASPTPATPPAVTK